MKKLVIPAAMVLFATILGLWHAAPIVHSSTTTLTGTFKDAQGNPVNGRLVLQLAVPAQDIDANVQVVPAPIYCSIVNGTLTNCPAVNDVGSAHMQPAGNYYQAFVFDTAGRLLEQGNFVITGTSFNLGAASPTSITTSNISYLSPAAVNVSQTWTAPQLFQTYTDFAKQAAPANPSTGNIRLYADATTGNFTCLTSTGGNCGLATIPFNSITTGTNTTATMTLGSGGVLNLSGTGQVDLSAGNASGFRVPTGAGLAPTTSGQIVFDTTSGSYLAGSAGSTIRVAPVLLGPSTVTLGADVTIPTTATTILTQAVTMPSAGGPFRVFATYGLYWSSASGCGKINAWVSDGTVVYSSSQGMANIASAFGGQNAGGFSTTTYGNGAAVTFALKAISDNASACVAKAAPSNAGGQNSWLQITPTAGL